jgi:hypothetical protein
MKIFKNRNLSGNDTCPICKTSKNGETVLIAIEGTQKGNIAQGMQFHLECLNLQWNKQHNIIYQQLEPKKRLVGVGY